MTYKIYKPENITHFKYDVGKVIKDKNNYLWKILGYFVYQDHKIMYKKGKIDYHTENNKDYINDRGMKMIPSNFKCNLYYLDFDPHNKNLISSRKYYLDSYIHSAKFSLYEL